MGSAIVFLKDKQPEATAFHNSLLAYLEVFSFKFRATRATVLKWNSIIRQKIRSCLIFQDWFESKVKKKSDTNKKSQNTQVCSKVD